MVGSAQSDPPRAGSALQLRIRRSVWEALEGWRSSATGSPRSVTRISSPLTDHAKVLAETVLEFAYADRDHGSKCSLISLHRQRARCRRLARKNQRFSSHTRRILQILRDDDSPEKLSEFFGSGRRDERCGWPHGPSDAEGVADTSACALSKRREGVRPCHSACRSASASQEIGEFFRAGFAWRRQGRTLTPENSSPSGVFRNSTNSSNPEEMTRAPPRGSPAGSRDTGRIAAAPEPRGPPPRPTNP